MPGPAGQQYAVGYPVHYVDNGDTTAAAIRKSCIQEVTKIYSHLNDVGSGLDGSAAPQVTVQVTGTGNLPTTADPDDVYVVIQNSRYYMYSYVNGTWVSWITNGIPIASTTVSGLTKLGTIQSLLSANPATDAVVTEDMFMQYASRDNVDVPRGVITAWWGNKANVPAGWLICDGTEGTPDLRDVFLKGPADMEAVLEEGGQDTVTLTDSNLLQHTHSVTINVPTGLDNHTHTLTTGSTTELGSMAHSHIVPVAGSSTSTLSGEHRHELSIANSGGDFAVVYDSNHANSIGFVNAIFWAKKGNYTGSVSNISFVDVPSDGVHTHMYNTSASVTLSDVSQTHTHIISSVKTSTAPAISSTIGGETASYSLAGSVSVDNRPPFFSMYYIIKM